MTRGVGGWSISPSFTYYPTVDAETAPAFRILTLLKHAMRVIPYDDPGPRTPARLEELVALALVKLVTLFQTSKASPLAVDSRNKSLVHYAAEMVSPKLPAHGLWALFQPHMVLPPRWEPDFAWPVTALLEVLECIVKHNAPVNACNTGGMWVLTCLISSNLTA